MGPGTVNRNKDSNFYGPYAGRDLYITMLEDTEREFVVTHNANIKPVSYFTGRETELQELRQRIEDGRKSVLVSGMGGIGKTHICRKLFEEYLNKHAEGKDGTFKHIGYIEYNGDMGSSLQKCLKFKQQDSPEQNLEAAWRELEYLASDGELLLFVDNVDKPMWADPGLQQLNSIPGAVVLTSRQASFSDEFEPYQIGFLGMEQCKEIYEKIRFRGSSRKVGLEEVEDLEYVIESLAGKHTITVEFLAHLARIKLWTVKRLRKELEKKGFRLAFHKGGELINIQKSYEVLYDLSQLSEAEQNILEAFSIFSYIPLESDVCNQWLLSDAGVSEEDDILMRLYQKGWLQFDIEQESYMLHPVFAQFIYEKCKPKSARHMELIESCKKNLLIPKSGSGLKNQWCIPFAENILERLYTIKCLGQAEFMEILAALLEHLAVYDKAEELHKKCLDIRGDILGENHIDTARSYNNLACVYEAKGEYVQAETLCEKSLQIREKVLGINNPATAKGYSNLGVLYSILGKYGKAEEMHKKSLKIRTKILGDDQLDTAYSYRNLAEVYVYQGKYSDAEGLHKKSLQILEGEFGKHHLEIANSYNNLAKIYSIQGKCAIAEKSYEKSLQIRRELLGEDHPDTASVYSNLVGVYMDMGNYEKAQEMGEKSLQIRESVFGNSHPDTADSYRNLAEVYVCQGDYKQAEEMHKKSLLIMKKVFGEMHPNTAIGYNNLAGIYRNKGEYIEAKKLYENSLQIYKEIFGENHSDTALAYCNLASVYENLEEDEKAEILYKNSLQIRRGIFGESHSDTAISYNNLAGVYNKRGDYVKAKETYKKGLQIWQNVFGENHPNTAISYNNLANIYEKQGEYEKAEGLYKRSLQIREQVLGEDHPDTAIGYNNLAGLYRHWGEYDIALIYYLKSYKILVFKFGMNHPHTQIVHKNMKITFCEWDTEGNFEQWLKENMKESD